MGSFESGVIAAVITWLLVPLFIRIAFKVQILDIPNGTIKTHKQPTPYLGGVAVGLGILLSFFLDTGPHAALLTPILIGSYAMLCIGLIDDIYCITYYQKFAGQLLIALWLVHHGVRVADDLFMWSLLGKAISLGWLLTLTNAFNLVDVMDGLATSIALGCTVSLTAITYCMGYAVVAHFLLLVIGSLLGFLWYNWPLATIYLGDAGALFVGCLLASVTLMVPWDAITAPTGWIIPVMLFALPLLEVISLIVIRSYRGIPFYRASPDHFSHYLKRQGWSVPAILLYVNIINFILLFTALFFLMAFLTPVSICIVAFIYFLIWLFVLIKF